MSKIHNAIKVKEMFVITRTGKKELLDTEQISLRIRELIEREPKIPNVDPDELVLKVCGGLKKDMTTSEIDEYASNVSASMGISNPYFLLLAGRLAIDNHQKNTLRSFYDKMKLAYLNIDEDGHPSPLLNSEFFRFVEKNADELEKMIDYNRDFLEDYFGIRMFQKSYSLKVKDKPIERFQDMFLREAIQVNMVGDIKLEEIKETYDLLSRKFYTHASPTCYNSGGVRRQLASCYLLGTGDSIEDIERTGTNSSLISKWAGGLGVHVNDWRSTGSKIKGTNGRSSGIIPFLKTYETRMLAFNQGGRRPGSMAVYLMPHHPDFLKFISIRNVDGNEKERARELFPALWIPDIFMERIQKDMIWSFFDSKKCGDLSNYHGEEYRKRYTELEEKKMWSFQLPARSIWDEIYKIKDATGLPYICFSDTVNRLSNHSNIGTIKSSNLCAEIMLYSSSEEYAVCVLGSISLSNIITCKDGNNEFPTSPCIDWEGLRRVTRTVVKNLNNVVDITYSPVVEAKRGNERHRPIGVGVQGLDDMYAKMRFPFDSEEAKLLNKKVFMNIYYSAVSMSTKMCRKEWLKLKKECREKGFVIVKTFKEGDYEPVYITYNNPEDIPKRCCAYPSIDWNGGSPIGKGIFHWELAGLKKEDLLKLEDSDIGHLDWESLRTHILEFGVKNSLLVALMPTASTSQLLGNNECFEPNTNNFYTRDTTSGQFVIMKKYLVNDLYRLGIWNDDIKDYIVASGGSIQHVDGIPDDIKKLYKTAYEIDQSVLVQQAIDRQPFVDQAQSLNLYVHLLTKSQWNKLMFQAWKGGLKTGCYYLHSSPAIHAQQFTIDPKKQQEMQDVLEKIRKNKPSSSSSSKPIETVCDSCSG